MIINKQLKRHITIWYIGAQEDVERIFYVSECVCEWMDGSQSHAWLQQESIARFDRGRWWYEMGVPVYSTTCPRIDIPYRPGKS